MLALKQHLIAKTLKAQEVDGYIGIMRTWAPRGQTPVFQETFNWKSLSIIGGLARWRFYLPRVRRKRSNSALNPPLLENACALLGHYSRTTICV